MAEAFGSTSCTSALVPESKLSHRSEAQYGLVPRLSHHGGKNHALCAEKPDCRGHEIVFQWSAAERCFSSDDVFSCETTCGDGGACTRARSQAHSHSISTKARRAKDISRGFFYVFVNNLNFSK